MAKLQPKVQTFLDRAPGYVRDYIQLQEAYIRLLESRVEALRKLTERTLHAYALRNRPPGYAHCPEGWELLDRPHGVGYERRIDLPVSEHLFGVVGYERPLSEDEVRSYELVPLGQRVWRPSL